MGCLHSYGPPINKFFDYSNPRIAVPNASYDETYDYMVVASELNWTHGGQDTSYVLGINRKYSGGGLSPIVLEYYNDGSLATGSPSDLSLVKNRFPVVTYDNNDDIWVGWIFPNINGDYSGTTSTTFPIFLRCDHAGVVNTPGSRYLEAPYYLYDQDIFSSISVAGRNYTDNVYTFSKVGNASSSAKPPELYTKKVDPTLGYLRIGNNSGSEKDNLFYLINKMVNDRELANKEYDFAFYDITGRTVYLERNNLSSIWEHYKGINKIVSGGIYIAKLNSVDGQFTGSAKTFIIK